MVPSSNRFSRGWMNASHDVGRERDETANEGADGLLVVSEFINSGGLLLQ